MAEDEGPPFGGMFPFSEGDLPPELAAMMSQMQGAMSGLAEQGAQQSKATKIQAALELQEIETRISVARAEAEVAAAETALLQAELADQGVSAPRRQLLATRITAQQKRQAAYTALADGLQSLYDAKHKLAELALTQDPMAFFNLFGAGGPQKPADGSGMPGKPDDPRFDAPPGGDVKP
ncbi:MAG TPA: hypothetical protein VJM32_03245 [Candidatus Saccharimonadales bacterium]|nr:hypothetical protein [Candidatus Saccharimonadales bacterium]